MVAGSGWAASGHNARLYYEDDHDKKRIGAWCVKGWDDFKAGAYLEIDLGSRKTIKYIATQGIQIKQSIYVSKLPLLGRIKVTFLRVLNDRHTLP